MVLLRHKERCQGSYLGNKGLVPYAGRLKLRNHFLRYGLLLRGMNEYRRPILRTNIRPLTVQRRWIMDDEEYLQKLDKEMISSHVAANHPESIQINFHEVRALCNVTRHAAQNVIDPLHRTVPILTKYEYAHVIGLRATQINAGANPFVEIDKKIVDGYLIAQIEIRQKKIPFILKRFMNNKYEYWKLEDLIY